MALREELGAAQKQTSHRCGVCMWLEALPVEEQEEWDPLFADTHSFGSSAFGLVLKNRGVTHLTEGQIKNHRRAGHRAG